MTKHFFVFLLFVSTICFSQNLYFNKLNYSDSNAFAKNITNLAKQVILKYKETNKTTYYDNLFRLQVVAQNYKISQNYIDTVATLIIADTNTRKAIGFAYRLYCKTMNESTSQNSFNDIYSKNFTQKYKSLSISAMSWAESYFTNDISELKTGCNNLIAAQNKLNTDSITINDALALCRKYCMYNVYSKTQHLALKILTDLENEKYISRDSVLIKMSDGATIALSIVRPRSNTPQPVVLKYSIYPGGDHVAAKSIADNGFIGIIANTRGKRLGTDDVEPFEHDAKDAYEIIDWISKQPWCNGKIGMYGGSYLGFSQWSAAKNLHPALKTIVPQVAVGVGIDYPLQNGVFMSYMLRWIHYVSNHKMTDDIEFSDEKKWAEVYDKWYKEGKSFRSLDTIDNRPDKLFQRWLDHPTYDSYWQNMTPQKEEFAKINIPILTITGYYDDDQLGAMHYYKEHQKWNKNANHYLLIGPFDHYGSQGYPSKELGGYTIDSVANIPIEEIVFKWFNYTLKDSVRPAILKDKVNFEVMGANEWRHVSSINKICNDTLTFYLSNIRSGNNYKLSSTKPSELEYIKEEIDFNARKKMPSLFDNGVEILPLIDSVLMKTERNLVFVSLPLEGKISINGSLIGSIKACINKKDVDIIVDVYEQMPDGKYFRLTEDLQRASLAKDKTKRQLLQPNKLETIPLTNTFTTSKQLEKGSKIIIVVGINKNKNWQINYGSGKDVSSETIKDAKEPLLIKWYNTSTIKLPIWK